MLVDDAVAEPVETGGDSRRGAVDDLLACALGGRARTLQRDAPGGVGVDREQGDGIAKLASAIGSRWDKLDILVICAAYLPALTPVTQIEGKQFNRALTVNVLATQALLANFDPLLKRAGSGRVVGLTSSVGSEPRPYWSAYGASKAAFDNLLESYGREVEKIGNVHVAVIDPGATRTAMRAKAYPGEDPQSVKAPEVVAERIRDLLVNDYPPHHRERIGS